MERFTLTQIPDHQPGRSVTDAQSGARIDFEAGNFNDSQEVVLPPDTEPEPLKLAKLMREFGEFMERHRELV